MSEHGGDIVAEVLAGRGVRHLFTLCGGHISPILVGAKRRGLHVVDMREEVDAVFAADATARLTGNVGVAAVTAGPGVTNTITAVKNAQMAESPVLVLGGATATVLRGRGSLQDIDQLSILGPITKWATRVTTVKALGPTIERAIDVAVSGVPGPVFVEIPIDLLYPKELVRDWYLKEATMKGPLGDLLRAYLRGHLARQFHQPHLAFDLPAAITQGGLPRPGLGARIRDAVEALRSAKRPVLLLGSQSLVNCASPERIARAVTQLGVPTYLGGMARGLLGKSCPTQFRHERGRALREADVVVVAGFPFDFRLKYGQAFGKRTKVVAANLDGRALRQNRVPDLALRMHPGELLVELADALGSSARASDAWLEVLRARENGRDREIEAQATPSTEPGTVNPVRFLRKLDEKLDDDAILVADGGDFVGTAAYILRPRGPLSWLDPGVFGTLGVGGGFAAGAAACRKGAEVWILYGDGSSAYSLSEFDTFVRHGMAPIAVVGTDGAWGQIARDQEAFLGDDVGTTLRRTAYHEVAAGYGGVGLLLDDETRIDAVLDEAKTIARSGRPVCVNVHLTRSDFRKGAISV